MLVTAGIILFVLLVVAHEYGHFLVAKRNNVEVEEFGIGLPPKIAGKKMGKGILRGYYSLNLIPLGGFVKLKGEHDADNTPGSYGSAKLGAKLKIMSAGVLTNLALAMVIFTISAFLGIPKLIDNQFYVASDTKTVVQKAIIGYVDENSPAEKGGLQNGDWIQRINGENINNQAELRQATKNNAGKIARVDFVRNGEAQGVEVEMLSAKEVEDSQDSETPKGYLGVVAVDYELSKSTWSAPIRAVGMTGQFTWLTLKAIGSSLSHLAKSAINFVTGNNTAASENVKRAGENISGPVGVFAIFRQGAALGYQFIFFLIGLISLTLAIMNFLPIPALDGGRVFVTLLFKALKKPLKPKTEDLIHGLGFATLMLLFVLITVVDVKRFF